MRERLVLSIPVDATPEQLRALSAWAGATASNRWEELERSSGRMRQLEAEVPAPMAAVLADLAYKARELAEERHRAAEELGPRVSEAGCVMCGAGLDGLRADARYCGPGCRKMGEYERARLQRHIESRRGGLMRLRALGASKPAYLETIEAEIRQSEKRLRELLGP